MMIKYPCDYCMSCVIDINNIEPYYCRSTGMHEGLRIALFNHCDNEEMIEWFFKVNNIERTKGLVKLPRKSLEGIHETIKKQSGSN